MIAAAAEPGTAVAPRLGSGHGVRQFRGVATSDLHLGYRAFAAQDEGRNVREKDVEAALATFVDRVLAMDPAPHVVTIAGDAVHNTRPSFFAVVAWRDAVRRLTEAGIYVVYVQGNHDGPKTADALNPCIVPDDLPGFVMVTSPRRVQVRTPDGAIALACFPFCVLDPDASWRLDPDPGAAVNGLVIHGAVRDSDRALPFFYAGREALDVGTEIGRWDVIACGDWHTYPDHTPSEGIYAPEDPDTLAFYSGAIERTTSNIWDEDERKGFVSWVIEDHRIAGEWVRTRRSVFHELPTRKMADFDLGDFDRPPGESAADVNFALGQLAESDDLAGAMVRLRVYGLPQSERHALDRELVNACRRRFLHFDLDLRAAGGTDAVVKGDGPRKRPELRSRRLGETAAEYFADDRPEVRDLALAFLGETPQMETGPAAES